MAEQESELDKIRVQLNSMELRLRRLESALAYSESKNQVNKDRAVSEAGTGWLFLMMSPERKRDWNHRSDDLALHGWAI